MTFTKPPLQVTPKVFNGIEVWRLSWPFHNIEVMILEPVLGLLALVFGVIILLKDNVICCFVIVSNAFLKVFIQDLDIEVPIHYPINLACISSPRPWLILPQTSLFPSPLYHLTPPQPSSTPTTCHLTLGDLFWSHQTKLPSSSPSQSSLNGLEQSPTFPSYVW